MEHRRNFLKLTAGALAGLGLTLTYNILNYINEHPNNLGIPLRGGKDILFLGADTILNSSKNSKSVDKPLLYSDAPSKDEIVELMSNADFFTRPLGKNSLQIVTDTNDNNEFIGIKAELFKNNLCGLCTLTSIGKLLEFIKTGDILDRYTIATTYNKLAGLSFIDVNGYKEEYFSWDNSMYFSGLPSAVKVLYPEYVLESRFLSHDFGARYQMVLPESNWPSFLLEAQDICKNGGFVILGGIKYGYGDILLATDVKEDGTAIIVDSWNHTVKRLKIREFFDPFIDPSAKHLGEQAGLLSVIGVIPA